MSDDELKQERRLRRQIDAFARWSPSRAPLDALFSDRARLLRIPFAILLICGSFLAVLPIFGVWMLPFGLVLLAVDIPALRPRISALLIRARRRLTLLRRRLPQR